MKLITLTQASDYIRRDTNADDTLLDSIVEGASHAVLNYLKSGADSFLDSNGEVPVDSSGDPVGVPFVVQCATMYLTSWLYRNRDMDEQKTFETGYLPPPVTAMLYALRDPALA